ncbi:MAG: 30S ribosomal protein S7 [Nanobdellota archaeon]
MGEVKFFNRWSPTDVVVQDPGLKEYISLKPRFVPRTGGRDIGNRFRRAKVSIVERLINKVMIPGHKAKKHKITSGHITGKAHSVAEIVEKAFEIIENKTKENPIAVLVGAIENSAPREEIISIEYGGARYPKAVESSPQRRVDFVLRHFAQGAYQKSFNSKKGASSALADEIISAYNMHSTSQALSKKTELERQADSAR